MRMAYPNELMHYGILGMKWGVRRYQNADGTLTPAGKRRYGTAENLARGMTKEEADTYDTAKKAAIASGKAAEVQKYSKDLSSDELATALNRIRTEQTLADLAQNERKYDKSKAERFADRLVTVRRTAESIKGVADVGVGLYNTVATIRNTFSKNGNTPWAVIGQNNAANANKEIIDKLIKANDWQGIKAISSSLTNEEMSMLSKRAENSAKISKQAEAQANEEKRAASKSGDAATAVDGEKATKGRKENNQSASGNTGDKTDTTSAGVAKPTSTVKTVNSGSDWTKDGAAWEKEKTASSTKTSTRSDKTEYSPSVKNAIAVSKSTSSASAKTEVGAAYIENNPWMKAAAASVTSNNSTPTSTAKTPLDTVSDVNWKEDTRYERRHP